MHRLNEGEARSTKQQKMREEEATDGGIVGGEGGEEDKQEDIERERRKVKGEVVKVTLQESEMKW